MGSQRRPFRQRTAENDSDQRGAGGDGRSGCIADSPSVARIPAWRQPSRGGTRLNILLTAGRGRRSSESCAAAALVRKARTPSVASRRRTIQRRGRGAHACGRYVRRDPAAAVTAAAIYSRRGRFAQRVYFRSRASLSPCDHLRRCRYRWRHVRS